MARAWRGHSLFPQEGWLVGDPAATSIPGAIKQPRKMDQTTAAFRSATPPKNRSTTCAPGAQMVRVGAGSSLAFQRLSREPLSAILSVRLAETVSRHFGTFRIFVTGGSKRPGNSGLRAAIRTAARARSGPANDMDGIRELPESFVTESRSATCDVGGTPGGRGDLCAADVDLRRALEDPEAAGGTGHWRGHGADVARAVSHFGQCPVPTGQQALLLAAAQIGGGRSTRSALRRRRGGHLHQRRGLSCVRRRAVLLHAHVVVVIPRGGLDEGDLVRALRVLARVRVAHEPLLKHFKQLANLETRTINLGKPDTLGGKHNDASQTIRLRA
eukprot:gene4505-biopygen16010